MLGISIFILYRTNGVPNMARLTKTNLTEHFRNQGLSEGFIDRFFKNIKKQNKEKELEKLTQDPEYQRILKKYNIKPVDWNQTSL